MLVSLSLVFGSMLLSFIFFITCFASLGFIVNVAVTPLHIWLSLLCSLVYGFILAQYYIKRDVWRTFTQLYIGCFIVFFSMLYISGLFYDISYDGQDYHQQAIGQLAQHWNPFREVMTEDRSHSALLLNHYAKGPWIYAAALYTVTGNIEQSKVFNLLLMMISFLLTLSAMKSAKQFSHKQSILFSLLLALNPVSIYQVFSFYIDGQLASLLLCLLALSYRMVMAYDQVVLASFIMSIALTANIKFTGVVYVVACIGIIGGWLWMKRQSHLYVPTLRASMIGLIFGICIIGYNPYITNTIEHQHPFYPLYGQGPELLDIMTTNFPPGFVNMNSWQKLYYATFSVTNNNFQTEQSALKVPFSVMPHELTPFAYGADVRIGGFGPWFSGIVVLTGMIIVRMLISPRPVYIYSIGIAMSIMLTVLINPESWWARYVPQLWFVPICMGMIAWRDRRKTLHYLGGALAGAVMMNLAMVSYPYFVGSYYSTQAFDQEMQNMAQQHTPINIYFGPFSSNRVHFEDWGIEYVKMSEDSADIKMEDVRGRYLASIRNKPLLVDLFSNHKKNE